MAKKSFLLYLDRRKEIDMLTDEQCGILFKALFRYADTGEKLETDDLALRVLFSFLVTQIDDATEKWEEVRKKRSEAGKMGGRPKKQTKAKKANGFSEKQIEASESKQNQTKAKKAVTVTDTVTGTVTVSDIPQDSTAPEGAAQPAPCDEEEKIIPWNEVDFELV